MVLNLRGLVPPVPYTSALSRIALCGQDLTHFAMGARLGKAQNSKAQARLKEFTLPPCGFINAALRSGQAIFINLLPVYSHAASITMTTIV